LQSTKKQNMQTSNETTLKDAILMMLKRYRLESGVDEKRLIAAWDSVTGQMISKHTLDLYIKQKKLFVKLDSAALKNELSYAKTKICEKLNEEVGKEIITSVVFL